MYGDVRRWEPVLNKHRMYLAWSLILHNFIIFTKARGQDFVCQMHLKHRDGGPIPLDGRVVQTMVWARENFHREDQSLVKQAHDARMKRAEEQEEEQSQQRIADIASAALDAAKLDVGLRGPKVFVEPYKGTKR
jgi:hypothetical protein